MNKISCHENCGACCIAPSISTPLPEMKNGKPAGERCINLQDDLKCKVYEQRPAVCREFSPSIECCGLSHNDAMRLIFEIEKATSPDTSTLFC